MTLALIYLIHHVENASENLARLAAEYGLRCIMRSNFHDFFLEHSVGTAAEPGLHRDYRDKFAASWAGILDAEGRVPADTWDIACMHACATLLLRSFQVSISTKSPHLFG